MSLLCLSCEKDLEIPEETIVSDGSGSIELFEKKSSPFKWNNEEFTDGRDPSYIIGIKEGSHSYALSAIRTKDLRQFVGVYDSIQQRVVLNDSSQIITPSYTEPYYDKVLKYNLIQARFTSKLYYVRLDNKDFVVTVPLSYKESEGDKETSKTLIYIYNGKAVISKLIEGDGYVTPWYKNSFIIYQNYGKGGFIYDTNGKEILKFEDGNNHLNSEKVYPLSYTKYLTIEVNQNSISIETYDINDESHTSLIGYPRIEYPDPVLSDARISYTLKSQDKNLWHFSIHILNRDGSTKDYTLTVDVNTGDCKLQ